LPQKEPENASGTNLKASGKPIHKLFLSNNGFVVKGKESSSRWEFFLKRRFQSAVG
jgi:hypothetical protein